ncbi:unnamed protein product, partial [Closterium sp. Naga37s-1]
MKGTIPSVLGKLHKLSSLDTNTSGLKCPDNYTSCGVPQDASSGFCRTCPDFCATCDKPKPAAPNTETSNSGFPISAVIVIVIAGVAAAVALAVILYYHFFYRHLRSKVPPQVCQRYPLRAVARATNGCFGIVMLEVMTGRPVKSDSLIIPSNNEAGRQLHILPWVQQQLAQYGGSEAVAWLKDARMEARDELVLRVVQLALRCTAMPTAMRPAMTEIAAELDAVLVEVGGKRINSAAHQVDQEMESQSMSAPKVMAFRGTAVAPPSSTPFPCRDPPIARFCPHAQADVTPLPPPPSIWPRDPTTHLDSSDARLESPSRFNHENITASPLSHLRVGSEPGSSLAGAHGEGMRQCAQPAPVAHDSSAVSAACSLFCAHCASILVPCLCCAALLIPPALPSSSPASCHVPTRRQRGCGEMAGKGAACGNGAARKDIGGNRGGGGGSAGECGGVGGPGVREAAAAAGEAGASGAAEAAATAAATRAEAVVTGEGVGGGG